MKFSVSQAGEGKTSNLAQNILHFVNSMLLMSYDFSLSTSDNVISLSVFLIITILLFVVLSVQRV